MSDFLEHLSLNGSWLWYDKKQLLSKDDTLLLRAHLLKKDSELFKSNLTITIRVKFLHEGIQFLFRHVSCQLCQLLRVYWARIILVNGLKLKTVQWNYPLDESSLTHSEDNFCFVNFPPSNRRRASASS